MYVHRANFHTLITGAKMGKYFTDMSLRKGRDVKEFFYRNYTDLLDQYSGPRYRCMDNHVQHIIIISEEIPRKSSLIYMYILPSFILWLTPIVQRDGHEKE